MRYSATAPLGYRPLGKELARTEKAIQFQYDYGVRLWIPQRAIVETAAGFFAPAWAIKSAKQYAERTGR